jgi:hypothetical protein
MSISFFWKSIEQSLALAGLAQGPRLSVPRHAGSDILSPFFFAVGTIGPGRKTSRRGTLPICRSDLGSPDMRRVLSLENDQWDRKRKKSMPKFTIDEEAATTNKSPTNSS